MSLVALQRRHDRQVVLTGTFDVRNYGDLLFPLVAAHKLGPFGIAVRPASPTGRATGWQDAAGSLTLAEALNGPLLYDAVLIGGGNIIHARPVTLPDYVATSVASWAYGALWQQATLAACQRQVPALWNAPGVPGAFEAGEQATLHTVLAAASYLSVRDTASARFLAPSVARVVPDTVLSLADLWPKAALQPDFHTLLQRKGGKAAGPYLAIHLKERSLNTPLPALAALIERFCTATGHTPILIGIGQCHDDHLVTQRLAALLTQPCIDLAEPLGLREIAAAIAFSGGYVGASMHGYITATAYGRAGVIVGRPRLPKMQGLLALLDRSADECADWQVAFDRMAGKLSKPAKGVPATATAALDQHWSALAAAVASQSVPGGAQARVRKMLGPGGPVHGPDRPEQVGIVAPLPRTVGFK